MLHSPHSGAAIAARPRPLRRMLAAIAVAALAAVVPAVAAPASAAEVPGAITGVTTEKSSYGYSERIRLDFTWAVPDSASAGDSFSLDLPDELEAATLARFQLLAPDGSIVAVAEWHGKSVDFTLTDYADSHDGVGGSGFVTVRWDHEHVPVTSQPIRLEFGGIAIEVVIGDKPTPQPCTSNCGPAPERTERGLWKGGSWRDGAYEGTRDESHNINWSIELPGDQVGYAGPITVVDTPASGSIVECDSIVVRAQARLVGGAPRVDVDPSRYSLGCAPTGFELVLDAVGASEFVTISYQGTITDQLARSFANRVEVEIAGETTDQVRTVKRTDAGGIGDGVQSVSVGDLVWLDDDRDGRQGPDETGIAGVTLRLIGPDGGSVVDVAGAPVGPRVTDADGRYAFTGLPVLPAGQHYTVVLDDAESAEALDGLSPTTAGTGDDRAVDSSTGSAESGDLTTNGAADPTLDFGFVAPLPELPTLPLPEDPGAPEPSPQLASTGTASALPTAAGALVLALLGGVAAALSRRAR